MNEDYSFRQVLLEAAGIGVKPREPLIGVRELEKLAQSDPKLREPYARWRRRRNWTVVLRICSIVTTTLAIVYLILMVRGFTVGQPPVTYPMLLLSVVLSLISDTAKRRVAEGGHEGIKKDLLALHRCPACGYDISGVPAIGNGKAIICPECASIWPTPENHLVVGS